MAQKTAKEEKTRGSATIEYGYVYEEKNPDDKKLVYKLNKNTGKGEFYPANSEWYFFSKIGLNGFTSLPEVFKEKGYLKGGLLYYLHSNFGGKVKSVQVNKSGKSQIYKRGRNKYLHLNFKDLDQLSAELGSINYYHRSQKAALSNKHFNALFPDTVKKKKIKAPKHKVKQAIRILSTQDAGLFEREDIDKITSVLSSLLNTRYKSQIKRSELFQDTKLKIETVTLDEVISDFEEKLAKKTSEFQWGKFLLQNLSLIDSKYIHALPQLNVVLGGTRKVDFGLIDTQGYLDIYEIKRPETKLLTARPDEHGNFVWHTEAVKAIVQAEKYHFHAERKSSNLENDIKRERDIDLEIKRPRAFVVIGHSLQFNDDKKKEDFHILRRSLKNIEIILYDELLKRVQNQRKSLA